MPLLPRPRWFPLAAAALLAAGVVACSDPYQVKARLDVVEDTLVFHSVSDASAPLGTAAVLDIAGARDTLARAPLARPLSSEFYATGAGFDVAIDVKGDSVTFLPPRTVSNSLTTVRRIGLRKEPTLAFDAITVAPSKGYQFDSVAVSARVGDVVYVVSQHPLCTYEYSQELYAKVGVLAIDPAARTATMRVRLDPNCGFRSFLAGVPKR